MAKLVNALLEELLEAHSGEIDRRGLCLVRELDPGWQAAADSGLAAALGRLLELALATVPDGCEIYLGTSRPMAAVSEIGAGSVTLRWQVVGERGAFGERKVTPLRPRSGDARAQRDSAMAERVRRAFAATGWQLELDVLGPGLELAARARRG